MTRSIVATVTALTLLCSAVILHAGQHAISQKGKAFSQETVTIKPGDELVFKNDDDVTHNVFSNAAGLAFNLKTQAPGTTAGQVFSAEGTAEVRCAFHPKMKLTVVVKK